MWTKELPTKPGFYWVRHFTIEGWATVHDAPQVVDVYEQSNSRLAIDFAGSDVDEELTEDVRGEWHGPLYPPD